MTDSSSHRLGQPYRREGVDWDAVKRAAEATDRHLRLAQTIYDLEEISRKLDDQVADHERRLLAVEGQVDFTSHHAVEGDLRTEMEELRAERDSLERRLAEKDANNRNLATKMNEARKAEKKSRANVAELLGEVKSLRTILNARASERDGLALKCTELVEELKRERERSLELSGRLASLNEQLFRIRHALRYQPGLPYRQHLRAVRQAAGVQVKG